MTPAFEHLVSTLNHYHCLSERAIQSYVACCRPRKLIKGELLHPIGSMPTSFSFLHEGLVRAYVIDEYGNEFNKNFFAEGRFPGCMTALLTGKPTLLEVQAMENCELINIDFARYRQALFQHADLMVFHINYLEKHWLLEKEPKEISYLQYEAKDRYQTFLADFSSILKRLPQYHIASYLGITPTQLSRIRKEVTK